MWRYGRRLEWYDTFRWACGAMAQGRVEKSGNHIKEQARRLNL